MGTCVDEAVLGLDETYWVDEHAALPVLLLDEATEAITAALHRVRCGSELDNRDLAAAGLALGDLLGGLGQLAEELSAAGEQQHRDRLKTLRRTTQSAQRAADGLVRDSARTFGEADQMIPRQRIGVLTLAR
jgi:hypothetical protein